MMRVALVVNAINLGGLEKTLLNLAKTLKVRGHEVSFVVTEAVGVWHELPFKYGFEVHNILPNRFRTRIHHAVKVANFLNKYDVCLLNHCAIAQSAAGLVKNSTLVIAVLHNLHEAIFNVGLANIENINAVIAVGPALKKEATLRLDGYFLPIQCIPNGIEVGALGSRKPRSLAEPLKIIYMGRIEHTQKGVLYLPKIVSNLIKANIPFSLDVVGDGPDLPELSKALSALIPNFKLQIKGGLDPESAMNMLMAADVLLLTSHYEGQGLVLIEGMSYGVIPIASYIEGVTDVVIEDNNDGFLVEPGNANEFAATIIKLFNDPELMLKTSKNAYSSAVKKYSVELMADDYLSLIENIVQSPKKPRNLRLYKRLLGKGAALPIGIINFLRCIQKFIKRDKLHFE